MKGLCNGCGTPVEARLSEEAGEPKAVCPSCGACLDLTNEPAPSRPLSAPNDEEGAFAELRAHWSEEKAHRDFLARFVDLEGLARAGARYREVLAREPSDGPAARARDEILKRATALGLGEFRAPPGREELPRTVKWGAVALLTGALFGGVAWLVHALSALGAVR